MKISDIKYKVQGNKLLAHDPKTSTVASMVGTDSKKNKEKLLRSIMDKINAK